jgi:hypothetical protein
MKLRGKGVNKEELGILWDKMKGTPGEDYEPRGEVRVLRYSNHDEWMTQLKAAVVVWERHIGCGGVTSKVIWRSDFGRELCARCGRVVDTSETEPVGEFAS